MPPETQNPDRASGPMRSPNLFEDTRTKGCLEPDGMLRRTPSSHLNRGLNMRGGRKRVSKACQRCRMRKTKCDGKTPCWRCVADEVVCHTGRRKTTSKKVPDGYVEHLEDVQRSLSAAVKTLYHMVRSGSPWTLGEPELNGRGEPLLHDIVKKLESTSSFPSLSNTFTTSKNNPSAQLGQNELTSPTRLGWEFEGLEMEGRLDGNDAEMDCDGESVDYDYPDMANDDSSIWSLAQNIPHLPIHHVSSTRSSASSTHAHNHLFPKASSVPLLVPSLSTDTSQSISPPIPGEIEPMLLFESQQAMKSSQGMTPQRGLSPRQKMAPQLVPSRANPSSAMPRETIQSRRGKQQLAAELPAQALRRGNDEDDFLGTPHLLDLTSRYLQNR